MRFHLRQEVPGQRALYVTDKLVYTARGMRYYRCDRAFTPLGSDDAPTAAAESLLSKLVLFRLGLRLGIHHLCELQDGGVLVVLKRRVLRCEPGGPGKLVMRIVRGNKPAHRGVCVTPSGTVLLGEYALNNERQLPVVLHRSVDHGRSFQPVLELKPGQARHIHFVEWDPFAQKLWMGTGDSDHECSVYQSLDDGVSWTCCGGGSQAWRAVGVAFRPEAIYWGTDAGSDTGRHPNHVMRFDRATGKLERVQELQGPCHGTTALADGTLLVSTGVEGGANEVDRRAHLWASRDGSAWQEVLSMAKNRLPYIVQFGVMRFPVGLQRCNQVIFTALGLRGAAETVYVGELVD